MTTKQKGWTRDGWKPGTNLPTITQLQEAIGQLDLEIGKREWTAGRIRADTFATNYLVNALASLLIQHRILRVEEIDYYVAMTEYQSKLKIEERTREPDPGWKPEQPPALLLPGRDF